MPKSHNSLKKTLINRKKFKEVKKRRFNNKIEGSPMARGIVTKLVTRTARQPNSATRKCAIVELKKNKKEITAYLTGDQASLYVKEHDLVDVQGIGGILGRARGDLPQCSYKVIKVNLNSLESFVKGKKKNPQKK